MSRATLLGLLVASAFLGPVTAGCGARAAGDEPGGNFTLEQAAAFDAFPLYWAGAQVDGYPLTAVVRREDTADYVSFVYGDCMPAVLDQGCAPPVEIQVWPVRSRSAGSYDAAHPGAPQRERALVNGRCAAYLDGTGLEIYEPRATVVVFAGSRERLGLVADALRPLGAPRGGSEAPVC